MLEQELHQFQQLKIAIGDSFRQTHPHCGIPIQEWKGQEIVNFQEDLQAKVKGRISEKWFYTHIKKPDNARLPRIDMLNMLSAYAGYQNWQEFKFQHQVSVASPIKDSRSDREKSIRLWGMLLGLMGLLGSGIWLFAFPERGYTFCFVDGTTGQAIHHSDLEVMLIEQGESPRKLSCDPKGCLELPLSDELIQLIVSAPYYHTDTIYRRLNKHRKREEIKLRTDDFALMIHFFSTDNKQDWQKHRKQLQNIFADHAKIFQVSPNHQLGMEMYNKVEFINKLTTPIKSLGQIEILETIYDKGKIVSMRFVQKEESK